MGWIVVIVVIIIGVIMQHLQKKSHQEALKRLTQAHEESISGLKAQLEEQEQGHKAQLTRLSREAELTKQRGHLGLAQDLLTGLDALERAHEMSAQDPAQQELAKGLSMVRSELERALERHGISRVMPELGHPFDPEQHEAVATTFAASEAEANTIAQALRPGWAHSTKLLRPAMVQVALKPASAATSQAPSPAPEDGDVVLGLQDADEAVSLSFETKPADQRDERELEDEEEVVGVSAEDGSIKGS